VLKVSVFCAAMALSLSACGGGSSDSNNSSSSPPAPAAATSIAQAIAQGEANGQLPSLNRDSSVAGPTTNGVRDDIAAYINSLPDTPVQKKALMQDAAAIQLALTVDTTTQSALLDAGTQMMKATHCLFKQYDVDTAPAKAQDLQKFTVNTRTRFDAYEKFNTAMSGSTVKSVISEDDCAQ
jgi:hypothetical protein